MTPSVSNFQNIAEACWGGSAGRHRDNQADKSDDGNWLWTGGINSNHPLFPTSLSDNMMCTVWEVNTNAAQWDCEIGHQTELKAQLVGKTRNVFNIDLIFLHNVGGKRTRNSDLSAHFFQAIVHRRWVKNILLHLIQWSFSLQSFFLSSANYSALQIKKGAIYHFNDGKEEPEKGSGVAGVTSRVFITDMCCV